MAKRLTDEQLEEMGRTLAQMHKDAIALWGLALKSIPLQSKHYRKICASGKAVQSAYVALRDEAVFERGWTPDRANEVFSSYSACTFN